MTALWRSAASGRYEDDLALCWLVRGPAERRTEGAADKRGDEVNVGWLVGASCGGYNHNSASIWRPFDCSNFPNISSRKTFFPTWRQSALLDRICCDIITLHPRILCSQHCVKFSSRLIQYFLIYLDFHVSSLTHLPKSPLDYNCHQIIYAHGTIRGLNHLCQFFWPIDSGVSIP